MTSFSNRPPGPPSLPLGSGRPPASAAFGDADDHRAATETVADLLETYGRLAFDTPTTRASQVSADCLQWAQSATRSAPGRKVVLQGAQGSPRTDWASLTQFFRGVRQKECSAVVQAQHDLTDAIQTFARVFHSFLVTEQALDTRCAKALLGLNSALTNPADAPLLDAAQELVHTVGELLREKREQDQNRLRALKNHVTQLEHSAAISCLHSPFEIDPATGLHNQAAFLEHVNFLAAAGALFDHPPLLVVLRVPGLTSMQDSLEDTSAVSVLSATLDETFTGRQFYLARINVSVFALAVAAVEFSSVHRATKHLLARGLNHRVLTDYPLYAGMASNVPGEEGAVWYRRAFQAADSADAFECVVAAAPASFEEQA